MLLYVHFFSYIRVQSIVKSAPVKTSLSLFFIHQPQIDTMRDRFLIISLNANDRLSHGSDRSHQANDRRPLAARFAKRTGFGQFVGKADDQQMGISIARIFLARRRSRDRQRSIVFDRPVLSANGNRLDDRRFVGRQSQARRQSRFPIAFLYVPHFCLSLNETDKIRLISAPQGMIF